MTELITGAKGSAHVTSAQQGAINAYTIGTGAYILNGCAATLPSANTLHIAAGYIMVQGRAIEITATDLTVANGSQGTKRHDLVCAHYTLSNGIESVTLSVIQGTPSVNPVDPTITGSILAGDLSADIPLWRVSLDGITPTVALVAYSDIGNITTSNSWDIQKFKSGLAICRKITLKQLDMSIGYGSVYYGSWGYEAFPSLFIDTPSIQLSCDCAEGLKWPTMYTRSKDGFGAHIISATSVNHYVTLHMLAVGRWL